MKIVYLVADYKNAGGIERVISLKSNYLISIGYEVHIVSCSEQDKDPFFQFDPRIQFHNLGMHSIKEKYRPLFLARLSQCLDQIKPDITISTAMRVMNYLYEVNDGSKKVLELHFSKYRRKFALARFEKSVLGRIILNTYYRNINRIVRQYDKFIVLTEEDKRSWTVTNIPNIEVIPNPLSFVPETCSDLTSKRIIAIGRHTYQKGFDILIDIWNKIESKYPEWKLTIFGSGRKSRLIEKKISKLNLSHRIELLPPSSDIVAEFAKSSIFALSSRYEGLPMVLLESMVCGVPPVCFACKCGPADVVKDGESGFLSPMDDKDTFARQLSKLIEDEQLRQKMGKAAREQIMSLQIENVMPKWISLFENLVRQ